MRNDENYCNESTALETIAFNPKPLKKLGKTQETLGFMTSTPARGRTQFENTREIAWYCERW